MSSYFDVLNKLKDYQEKYRRLGLPPLEVSGLYSLFPETEVTSPMEITMRWPDDWPNVDRQGVYVILGDDLDLLYVGKASMKSTLGTRLNFYFSSTEDKRCRVNHDNWKNSPRYVVTIAVPREMPFEAPAIEEFLIRELGPPENAKGRG